MKRRIVLGACNVLLMTLVAGCASAVPDSTHPVVTLNVSTLPPQPAATPSPGAHPEAKLVTGKISSEALAHNLLGDPSAREFRVYLPPGYDTSGKRYPVVYVLHGYGGDHTTFSGMGGVLTRLIAKAASLPMILVFPDASNRLGGSSYLSSPTIGDYEAYIANELVSQIDSTYRTLRGRESRGITGCSMGGDGAAHLALKYPDVFSVVASMSGTYDWQGDPGWEEARSHFVFEPRTWQDWLKLDWLTQAYIAPAAAASPNPDKPPFYLDMPFEITGTMARIVPEVYQRINALDPLHDLGKYLAQPVRLRALMIYHGDSDPLVTVDLARRFDITLTALGVEHSYVEVKGGGHCDLDWVPVLKSMSDHLVQ